jgi:RHO1 GDP-GTP exchange protein 1/2
MLEFGLYVDRHGELSRAQGLVEWEGTAERVAFHPPHILIFDTRFVEVRHIGKGTLVQIITGTDIHCTWDGRGSLAMPSVTTPGPNGWDERETSQETRVHAVMKADKANTISRAVAQHLFELEPTQLLHLPPPVQSPTNGYFAPSTRSASPPHSLQRSSVGSGWTR